MNMRSVKNYLISHQNNMDILLLTGKDFKQQQYEEKSSKDDYIKETHEILESFIKRPELNFEIESIDAKVICCIY